MASIRLTPIAVAEELPSPEVVPVVLVHGFAGGPEDWRGTSVVLKGEGFDPLLLDWQPGPSQGTLEVAHGVVDPAIAELLSAAGYGPQQNFHLVGHSLGGLVARALIEQPRPGSSLADRALSLVTLSTPNQGARTGLARAACHLHPELRWRRVACDMVAGSAFLEQLAYRRPARVRSPYLSIGVEASSGLFAAPAYDGNGDGHASGHDNAVMAEASYLEGAHFVVWRGLQQSGHDRAPCSAVVNRWIAAFLRDGSVPTPPPGRQPSDDSCAGVTKRAWRQADAAARARR